MKQTLHKWYRMYADGFRGMTIGRTLWLIIIIKLAIMFALLRPLLFPDRLGECADDDERAATVRSEMVQRMAQ